jgi:hypothetical protein
MRILLLVKLFNNPIIWGMEKTKEYKSTPLTERLDATRVKLGPSTENGNIIIYGVYTPHTNRAPAIKFAPSRLDPSLKQEPTPKSAPIEPPHPYPFAPDVNANPSKYQELRKSAESSSRFKVVSTPDGKPAVCSPTSERKKRVTTSS